MTDEQKLCMFGALMAIFSIVAVVGIGLAYAESSPYDKMPDHTTCTYNDSQLRQYAPDLKLHHLDSQPRGVAAGIYSSPERDTDVYAYWLYYVNEPAEWVVPLESYFGDHEPILVEVSDSTGDIVAVHYDSFHYAKASVSGQELYDNDSHPDFEVSSPYHYYNRVNLSEVDARNVSQLDIDNFCDRDAARDDKVDNWVENGWDISQRKVMNPWLMSEEEDWWENNPVGSATGVLVDIKRSLVEYGVL